MNKEAFDWRAALGQAAEKAKAVLPEQLKRTDWSKMVGKEDVRNALIGSALGGLVLGGTSLAQDRDPEESKLAPVGDALIGALAGGMAGYGIPKGLEIFRNPGFNSGDQPGKWDGLKDRAMSFLGWSGLPFAGALTRDYFGGYKSLANKLEGQFRPDVITGPLKTHLDSSRRTLDSLLAIKDKKRTAAQKAQIKGLSDTIGKLRAQIDGYGTSFESAGQQLQADIRTARGLLADAKHVGDPAAIASAEAEVARLKDISRQLVEAHDGATRVGPVRNFRDIIDHMRFSGSNKEKLLPPGGGAKGVLGVPLRFAGNRFRPRGYNGSPRRAILGQAGKASALTLVPLLWEALSKAYDASQSGQ